MTQGKILLISWTLPPEPTGSAVIVGNLAKQFTASEMILAGEKPFCRPPVTWNEDWPPLIYIARSLPPGWRGARWWRWIQIPLMLSRCIALVRKYNCTRILAVFPNEDFLLVAYLTSLWTGLPLWAYFHNTFVENRRGVNLRFARWLQERIFRVSRHTFVMSEGMVELYRRNYPSLRCSALVHSFNEDIPEFAPLPDVHSPLRVVICGNINESCRDAAVRFCEAVTQMNDVLLTVISGTPPDQLRELGILRHGTPYETVSRDDVLNRLRAADVLFLPHGFSGKSAPEEYETMFPTKTIEYLISGRPVLAHTPSGCYLTRFLKTHKCAFVVDEPNVAALIDAVESLRSDRELRAGLVQRALRAAQMFHAPVVAMTLRAQIQKTI